MSVLNKFKVGDLVRYKQGSLDGKGIVVGQGDRGDYLIQFLPSVLLGRKTRVLCRWRNLELISDSR